MFGYGRDMSLKNTLYDQDFYAWANTQAELLRAGKLAEADIENIAEEIESMGRSERSELVNRLDILLAHLLKWQFQPERRGRSWELTVKEQRFRISRHLERNPSLKSSLGEALVDAYEAALFSAQRETDLDENVFPSSCPWSIEEILDRDFMPLNERFAGDLPERRAN